MVTAAAHHVPLIGELKHKDIIMNAAAQYVPLIGELKHKDIMVTAVAHCVPLTGELNTLRYHDDSCSLLCTTFRGVKHTKISW